MEGEVAMLDIRIISPEGLCYNRNHDHPHLVSPPFHLRSMSSLPPMLPPMSHVSISLKLLRERKRRKKENKNITFYFLRHTSDLGCQISRDFTDSPFELSILNLQLP